MHNILQTMKNTMFFDTFCHVEKSMSFLLTNYFLSRFRDSFNLIFRTDRNTFRCQYSKSVYFNIAYNNVSLLISNLLFYNFSKTIFDNADSMKNISYICGVFN